VCALRRLQHAQVSHAQPVNRSHQVPLLARQRSKVLLRLHRVPTLRLRATSQRTRLLLQRRATRQQGLLRLGPRRPRPARSLSHLRRERLHAHLQLRLLLPPRRALPHRALRTTLQQPMRLPVAPTTTLAIQQTLAHALLFRTHTRALGPSLAGLVLRCSAASEACSSSARRRP
jgi:hypothetical protein